MADINYITRDVNTIIVGEPLPATLYIYIDFRFITFRAEGDSVDRDAFDRLQLKKIKQLFISETDKDKWEAWIKKYSVETPAPTTQEQKDLVEAREDVRRKMLDIFQTAAPNKIVGETLVASKKLVGEVMKTPFATRSLAELQSYSRGTVDHSVNVSVLSVYLAMQMGYTHNVILQNIGAGALLHDLGKSKVPVEDGDSKADIEVKMMQHPALGVQALENDETEVPSEVKMIIMQHHENWDGSGFPKGLRGQHIYDLARIVSIANMFDELVIKGQGTLVERQKVAVAKLDEELFARFDPQKLEKILKILKMGL